MGPILHMGQVSLKEVNSLDQGQCNSKGLGKIAAVPLMDTKPKIQKIKFPTPPSTKDRM